MSPALRSTANQAAWRNPASSRGLVEVFARRHLVKLLVKKELRVRYRGSYLGIFWSYVKPAVQYCVYFLALGIFLGRSQKIEHFPLYMFSGLVLINLFSEALGNATRSVIWNADLVKKIYLPRELFPVSSVCVAVIHFVPQFVVLAVASILFGYTPSVWPLLGALVALVIVICLALGLGLLFGALNVLYRDLENFVDLGLMVVVWASPVLYLASDVSREFNETLFFIYQANPITIAVELFHAAFWRPTLTSQWYQASAPTPLSMAAGLGVSVLILIVGQVVFKRIAGRFAREL